MNYTINQKKILIQRGYKLLHEAEAYHQADVVQKLIYLDCPTTRPVFNRIIKDTKVGEKTLHKIFTGFQLLMEKELGMKIGETLLWEKMVGHLPEIIPTEQLDPKKEGFIFHTEGRLEIKNKVKFYNTAQDEIYEVGLTLNTFSSYFLTRKPSEFKEPISELLKKGIHIKCFLLDPEWNGTKLYFSDREEIIKETLPGVEKIRASLRNLKAAYGEFESKNWKGKFEVFTYRHLPHNYFLALDPKNSADAKMMISNYLFGVRRAACPVFEFSRKEQPILFNRYHDSLTNLIKGAKKVDFTKIAR